MLTQLIGILLFHEKVEVAPREKKFYRKTAHWQLRRACDLGQRSGVRRRARGCRHPYPVFFGRADRRTAGRTIGRSSPKQATAGPKTGPNFAANGPPRRV